MAKKSKTKKTSVKKAGKTSAKKSAAMKASWANRRRKAAEAAQAATPIDTVDHVAETKNSETVSIQGHNFESEQFDSRGSVLEHLAHVLIVQADAVKAVADAA